MEIVVNAALSVDGKLASRHRQQLTLSGPDDLDRVDQLRAACDGVMVGIGTVVADNPQLTVKDPSRIDARRDRDVPAQPARVIVDSTGRTPLDAHVLDDTAATYILVSESATGQRITELDEGGATVIAAGHDRVDLVEGMSVLSEHGIDRMLVEGGGELIFSLFEVGLVDSLSVFIAPMIIGGRDAPTLTDGTGFDESFPGLSLDSVSRIDTGVLLEFSVRDPSRPST